jgi:hypothetical protein
VRRARTDELKRGVESQLGGKATYVHSVFVEPHHGDSLGPCTVAVFDLADHLTADRAYAWSYQLDNGKRRLFAVLHTRSIASPTDAVAAAVVAERRRRLRIG